MTEFVHISARYAGTCKTSGIYYPKGRPIAYYPATRQTHILMGISAKHDPWNENPKSPLFQYVEGAFKKWLDGCQPQVRKSYEWGDLDKKGAILQAIEDAQDLAREKGRSVWLHECDLRSSFTC